MPSKNRQFAKFVVKHREKRGLSQRQLAEMIGVTKPTIHYWETAHVLPQQIGILEPLSRALHVDFEDLLALTKDAYKDSLLAPNIYFRATFPGMSKKEKDEVERFITGFEDRRGKGRKRGN
jgi:transcriptional regulator with XRE-family HTH domain